MTLFHYLAVLGLVIAFIIAWNPVFRSARNYRHLRNQRRAREVLGTIRSMKGDHTEARAFAYLRKISPYVLEELVLTCFEEQGHRIARNRAYSGDGGVDGRVHINGREVLIQTKRFRKHIRLSDIHAFTRVVARHRAPLGLFVHTGRTGSGVYAAVRSVPVRIVSGNQLIAIVRGEPGSAARLLPRLETR